MLRVTAAELDELWLMREEEEEEAGRVLGMRVGRRVLLTRERAGPLKNSSVRLNVNDGRAAD